MDLAQVKALLSNPAERAKLSVAKLNEFYEILKESAHKSGKAQSWDSPGHMAYELSRKYRGRTDQWDHAPHLDLLDKWLVDLYTGDKKNLLISFPPRHGKTELVVFWHALWRLHKDPTTHIMYITYAADLAERLGGRIRNFLVEVGPDLGLKLRSDSASRKFWQLEDGGSMRSVGVGGAIRGMPADLILGDDLVHGIEAANSEVQRKNLFDWWRGDALNRLEPGGSIALIGSRYHEQDIMGRLEDLSNKKVGRVFHIYKLPAIVETDEQAAGDPMGRAVGETLWPTRYTKDELEEHKAGTIEDPELGSMTSFLWNAVYQQDPTPVAGSIIDPTWWQFYTERPQGFDEIIQSWDLAFKGKESSDHVVGQVWGRDGAHFYLLDQIRKRMGFVETLDSIRNMAAKWPDAGRILIEDAANGPAVINALHKEIRGIVPIKTQGTDKGSRLFSVSHMVQAGQVFLPNVSLAPWINDLIHEVTSFRADADNAADDQCDALSQALRYFLPQGKSSMIKSAKQAASEASRPKTTQEMVNRAFHDGLKREVDRNMRRRERMRPRWERATLRF